MSELKRTEYPSTNKPWMRYYAHKTVTPIPNCTAYELLRQNNEAYLNDIALNYFDRKITYGELLSEIDGAAASFYALGIRQGDIVIVCSVNMPETVYTLYGLNRLGAVINLVDPRTNEETLHHYIDECNAKLVLTVDLAYPIIKKAVKGSTARQIITVSPGDSLPGTKKLLYRLKNRPLKGEPGTLTWPEFVEKGSGVEPVYASFHENACAIIAHTGGTTGIPKGVMVSNENINAVTHDYRYTGIPFARQERYFNDLPPFIIYGLTIALHTTLCYGQEVVLYPVFDSKGFPKLFRKYRPNHFSALTDHLRCLIGDSKVEKMDLSFLITPAMGGDSLNIDTEQTVNNFLRAHGCRYQVVKGYGMTELCATACTSFAEANALGSVGIPLVSNTVKIVDLDSQEELPCGQTGEIWISGPSTMLGYYKNPKATAEVIITDTSGIRWVRTGDLGHMNEDGLLFHDGRIRRIYLTAVEGQPAKIFPGLVEDAIKSSPAVAECMVVGRTTGNSTYYESVAFVILKEGWGENTVETELDKLCIQQVPSYMRPVEYRFVSEFPYTPIGKVNYRALEELAKMKR